MDLFAGSVAPVTIPRLEIRQLDNFLALVPAAPLPALNRWQMMSCAAFEPFRAPLTEAELERRSPDSLSPVEFRNLLRWGYPYVFERSVSI